MPCPYKNMTYDPEIHHRRSIRLKGYDYSQDGAYFVTVCSGRKECLFGDIINSEIDLSAAGKIVMDCLMEIPHHFENVELDTFIVMPNHLHAIVVINDNGRGMACHAPTKDKFGKPIPHSLSTIIGSYKSAVTRICNKNGNIFQWQRNYYEHIICNEDELHRIRQYIINNPLEWDEDIENPFNREKGKAKNYYENLLICKKE